MKTLIAYRSMTEHSKKFKSEKAHAFCKRLLEDDFD